MDRILIELIFYSLDFSEISEGSRVNCFGKFPKGEGLNRLRKFTGQGTCSHIHSEVFLGNLRCFWDSVGCYFVDESEKCRHICVTAHGESVNFRGSGD